jgi:serine/threonine protein kinase
MKICDLGWAIDNIKAKRRTFCGIYDYMSPEMIFDKDYDFTIDIWALGILLYYLLHGHTPFIAKIID